MSADLPAANAHDALSAGRDELSARTVRTTEQRAAWVFLGLVALCLLPVLGAFFSSLFRDGIGSALASGLLALLLMAVVFLVLNRVLQALLVTPYRALQYRGALKRMQADLPGLGVQLAMQHQWSAPTPGVLALDTRQGLLYANARDTDYQRLLLRRQDILGAKVERESEVHTQTRHGGSLAVFSSAGIGYNFGSRSKSTSKVVERAFLEIHYQLPGAPAPGWLAVPFGEDRRAADSFAVAIQRL